MKHFLQAILVLLLPLLLDHQAEGFPFTKVPQTTTNNNESGSGGQAMFPDLVNHQGKNRKLLIVATMTTTDALPTANHHKVDIRFDELPASHPMATNDATTSTGNSLVKASKASATSKGNAKEDIADIIDIADYSSAKRKPPIHN